MSEKGEPSGKPSPELKHKLEELEEKVDEPTQITRIKRLKELQEKLEGTHRIEKLKKFKKKIFIWQILGMIILFPLIVYLNGASLEPLYIPLSDALLMVFGWTLVLVIEHFVFTFIRIKRHKTPSTKCLIARKNMKRSLILGVVAILIFSLIYGPFVIEYVEEGMSYEEKIELSEGEKELIEFSNKDALGFLEIKRISIKTADMSHANSMNISLYENENEIDSDEQVIDEYHLEGDDIGHNEFKNLTLELRSDEYLELTFTKNMQFQSNARLSFSILGFAYIGVFFQAAAIFYPIRIKYKGSGVYG